MFSFVVAMILIPLLGIILNTPLLVVLAVLAMLPAAFEVIVYEYPLWPGVRRFLWIWACGCACVFMLALGFKILRFWQCGFVCL